MTQTWWKSAAMATALVVGVATTQALSAAGQEQTGAQPREQQGTGTGSGAGGSGARGSGQGSAAASSEPRSQDQAGGENAMVEKMFMANMAEIELGRLAVQRAENPDVKAFAQMMVDQHTRANQELATIAQQLGVQQPQALDEKHRTISDGLSQLQGAEFDREYMKTMVMAHQQVASELRPLAGGAPGSAASTEPASTAAGAAAETSTAAATGRTGAAAESPAAAAGAPTRSDAEPVGTSGTTAGAAPRTVPEYAAKTLPVVQQHLQHAQRLQQSVAR